MRPNIMQERLDLGFTRSVEFNWLHVAEIGEKRI